MPVPLTTACIAGAAVILPLSEIAAAVLASLGVLNQAVVEIVVAASAGKNDDDR